MEYKVNNNPTQEQVRQILDSVYNKWFTKYKNASTTEECKELRREANELDKKYPFTLCHVMVLEMLNIIENYCKERGE